MKMERINLMKIVARRMAKNNKEQNTGWFGKGQLNEVVDNEIMPVWLCSEMNSPERTIKEIVK
jgi:hypothetical protein